MIPYKKENLFDNDAAMEAGESVNSTGAGDPVGTGQSTQSSDSVKDKKKFYSKLPISPKLRETLLILKIVCLILGLAFFVALTLIIIITGVKSFYSYSVDMTITRTQLYRNRSIQLPPPTLCVQLDSSEFDYGEYENLETLEDRLKDAMDKKLFAKLFGGWPDELAKAGSSPDAELPGYMPLILLTARMIVDITRSEQPFFSNFSRPRWNRFEFAEIESLITSEEKQSRERSALVLKFFNDKLNQPEDLDFLTNVIKSIGSLICTLMETKVKPPLSRARILDLRDTHPCFKDNVTWLGLIPMTARQEEMLCVKIKGPRNFRFSSSKDKTVIGFSPQKLYNESETVVATEAFVDFTGQRVTNSMKTDVLLVPFQKLTTASITISSEFESINSPKSPCSPTTTSWACRRICKAKLVQAKCGCFPLSMFYGYEGNGVGYCSEKRTAGSVSEEPFTLRGAQSSFLPRTNKSCTAEIQKAVNNSKCACPEKCGHTIINFNSHQDPLEDDADNETTVVFQVGRFSYLHTKEIPVTDTWDFAMDLAITLGVLIFLFLAICWILKSLWKSRYLCLPKGRGEDLQVIFRKEHDREIEIHPTPGRLTPASIIEALKSLEGQEYLKSFFKTFVVEANENKYETIPPRR